MRAAVVSSPKKWEIIEVPRPEPGEGQCRVKIEACGICGSDLHFMHHNMFNPAFAPGHEMAGIIDAVGPGCDGLQEGQRVTVEPIVGCGQCRSCQDGQHQTCRAMQVLGFALPGGFSEYVVAPAKGLFPVAQDLDPSVVAMGEPVAVSVHGLHRGGFEPGHRVLVLGAGTVGLVTMLAARAMGASEVWASARHAHQAELATTLGATRVLTEEEADPGKLAALSMQVDFDVVVETVGGSADTLRAACAAVRPGGRVSVLGLFDSSPTLEPFMLLLKEGTLCWSNCYAHPTKDDADFATAVKLLDDERELLARMATHQLPIDDIGEAFRLAGDKSSGAVKVHVRP